jgi:hypothetical protein
MRHLRVNFEPAATGYHLHIVDAQNGKILFSGGVDPQTGEYLNTPADCNRVIGYYLASTRYSRVRDDEIFRTKGQIIHVIGWLPESLDESLNSPQAQWEHWLVGIGSGQGMFEFLGNDDYRARRDLTFKEVQEIMLKARDVSLVIHWR